MPIYVKADKVKSEHTYTQFPIIINDNTDGAVPEWGLFGNGQQTGTPSPDNIIMPTFCGVRTANWLFVSTTGTTTAPLIVSYTKNSAEFTLNKESTSANVSAAVLCDDTLDAGTYSIKVQGLNSAGTNLDRVYLVDINNNVVINNVINNTAAQFTLAETTTISKVAFVAAASSVYNDRVVSIMLNSGNTALPYEPYGYKLPITCGGQTVPVYLGQTQTVRRVKKLVLTGEENILDMGNSVYSIRIAHKDRVAPLCTHYVGKAVGGWNTIANHEIITAGSSVLEYRVRDDEYQTLADFKAYLAEQYANGTPVCVWYVLAEPTTGIINEPLCKIGDYADELHSADAGVALSLQTGTSNTISIESDLQPSKMNIQYYSEGYTDVKKIPMSGGREVKHVLDANGLYVYKSPNYYNWQNIRDIVRAGKGETYYPVGSIIYDNFDSSTGTAFQVVAHDHHFDPTLTAQGYTHSMTLCEVALTDVITFDAEEAFIYTDTVMPAGTYKFKIPNYESAYGGNKTYYFTSTADLPAGSQIVMTWAYHQPPASVTAYSGATPWTSTTAVTGFNDLPLTEWDESVTATDLGTIAGAKTELGHSDFGTMNHIHRARYGSNNYLQSGLRQYINSDGAANTWWQAQTVFDRPYESRSSAGKLTKLNAGMVAVMAKPEIQSRTNSYFETTSFDGTTFTLSTNYTITTDKIFLLSPKELNINTADKTVGSVLDYYVNAGNAERIKYRKSDGSAYYWWLRTPYPSYAHQIRLAAATGALNNYSAYASVGVASACVIQ